MKTMEGRVSHLGDTIMALQATVNTLAQNCSALEEGLMEGDDRIELIETVLIASKSVEIVKSQIRRAGKALGAVAQDVFA